MPKYKEIRCENCDFWRIADKGGVLGECHRRSPRSMSPGGSRRWPLSYIGEDCGDHSELSSRKLVAEMVGCLKKQIPSLLS